MPTVSLPGAFHFQAHTTTGALAASYRLYTFAPSTTTKKLIYTDAAGTVAHTYVVGDDLLEYVALNSRGELPSPAFLMAGGYDMTLKTDAGVTVWTYRAASLADAGTTLSADLLDVSTAAKGDALVGWGAIVSIADGVLTRHASLAAAVSAISTTRCTVIVRDDVTMAASATFPTTATLRIENRAQVTTTGYTLTINGKAELHTAQCFAGSGTVVFGAGAVDASRPEWFGTGTTAWQYALDSASALRCSSGNTYNLTGDITIPANRKIIVERGATVINTGGRFTADAVSGVEWHIDGWVKSVAMTTAAAKTGWEAGSRGFIEFGEAFDINSALSGFWVHGTGKVSGDWTGTPNFSDSATQINRKGIASWNACNVLVEGLEVFGFDGEAIYAFFFSLKSKNIVFRNNYVHDTRFSALNFNAGLNGGGCSIHDNHVDTAFQVELSAGNCSGNDVRNCPGYGIYTGDGAGTGPLTIKRNVVKSCGGAGTGGGGIYASFAVTDPVTDVSIEDNVIISSYSYSIYSTYCRDLTIRGNKCIGTGQSQGGYDIGVLNALRGSVSENTFMEPGSFAQSARILLTSAIDVAVSPDTNVYIATTGTATLAGNPAQDVASAAAVTLPVIGKIFTVTGTTNITSIVAAGNSGREVTLIFADALTFTDGSNLKLAGNLSTSADDTITLVCDGTNWFERGRSAN
jgi:hypothetical protein